MENIKCISESFEYYNIKNIKMAMETIENLYYIHD